MISIICESINEDYPTERSRGGPEPDDSLTNMEWLPEVSIPYMQQVRCKISQEDMKKMPRKRNRNVPSTSGELELLLVLSPGSNGPDYRAIISSRIVLFENESILFVEEKIANMSCY